MIDGIKISTNELDFEELSSNPLLDFVSHVNTDTGEIKYNKYGTLKKYASYYGLEFIIIESKKGSKNLMIKGSLHKCFNIGKHNYNDFNFNNIQFVLYDFEQKFNLHLDKCVLSNLEIGINIIPPLIPAKILQGLLLHKTTPFKNISMDNADYYQVEHKNNFFIKVYDKAKQYREKGYNIDHDILRIELKYVKMDYIIKRLQGADLLENSYLTLKDLVNINVLRNLGNLLLEKWKEVLFYDPTINVTNPDHNLELQLSNWQNSLHWEKLDKRKRYKEKIKLSKITNKFSHNIQSQINKLIADKFELLIPNEDRLMYLNNELIAEVLDDAEISRKGLIDSISKESLGLQKEIKTKSKKIEIFIPDYEKWISDPRPLPF